MVPEDPWHPIIDQPYAYYIRRVTYDVFGEDCGEPYLDLELQRDDVVRRLRFWSPQSLQLGSINRYSTSHMLILDIRGRGWEGLGVEVVEAEMDEISRDENEANDFPFGITISKRIDVLPATIDNTTLELFDLAESLGGNYDGWETSVER